MELVMEKKESAIERARRRAPIGGPIPNQEIPYFLHCEETRYRKTPDHIALTRVLILFAMLCVAIVIAGSHWKWSF